MPLRTTMMRLLLLVVLVSCTAAHATDWSGWEVRPLGYSRIKITNKMSTGRRLTLAAGAAFVEDGTHQTLVLKRDNLDLLVPAHTSVYLATYCTSVLKSIPKRLMTRTPSQVCVSP